MLPSFCFFQKEIKKKMKLHNKHVYKNKHIALAMLDRHLSVIDVESNENLNE